MMGKLDSSFKPKLTENVESGYKKVDLMGHAFDEDLLNFIAKIIFDNSRTYYISGLIEGNDHQDFNIKLSDLKDYHPDWSIYDLYYDDSKFTPVGTINVDRFVGKIDDFFETGEDAEGPNTIYWFNAVKGLEELSLVDDKNRVIYNIPKGSYVFNSIDAEMKRMSEHVFTDDWAKDQYDDPRI